MSRYVAVALLLVAQVAAGDLRPGPSACLDLEVYPRVRSWIQVSDPRGVVVDGDHAYLTEGDHGLTVIDVSDPDEPAVVATLDLAGFPYEVAYRSKFLYVAASEPDLYVIDVSDPTRPSIVAQYSYKHDGLYLDVDGRYLYLVSRYDLHVFDLHAPDAPQCLGGFDLSQYGYNVDVADGRAFIGTWSGDYVTILDVHDPRNVALIGLLQTPSTPHDAVADGDLLYVADRQTGLRVYDLTSPGLPTFVGAHFTEEDACMRVHAVGGGLVLVGDGYAGMKIVDVSRPASPKLVGESGATLYWQTQAAVQDDLAFVPVSERGLQIVDLANLGVQPVLDRFFVEDHESQTMLLIGDWAYVGGWPTVWAIPVSPAIGQATTVLDVGEYGYDLARSGDRLYVAASRAGVRVLDVADPASPILLGGFDTANAATGVAFVDGVLFVSMMYNDHGLKVLDADDPSAMVELAHLSLANNAYDVEVVGHHAYVASRSLSVVDVSDPTAPVLVAELLEDSTIWSLAVVGDRLFASSSDIDGIYSIDVSDPAAPAVCGQVTTPVGGRGRLAIVGSLLYAPRDYAGLMVLDITEPAVPRYRGFVENDYQAFGVRAVAAAEGFVLAGNYLGKVTKTAAPCPGPTDPNRTRPAVATSPRDAPGASRRDLSLAASPNPANPRVEVQLTVERPQHVRAAVFDSVGRQVTDLLDRALPHGEHRVVWDGLDARGRAASSGVYLIRAQGELVTRTVKVSLIR